MFVGGLHPSLTTETLINYFSQFGEIEKGIIMTDKITGKSRGFGFIIFSKKETIDKIMSYSYCHFLYGKWVECKRARPKIQNMKMLDDKESFPKLNYQNSLNNLSHDLINNNWSNDCFESEFAFDDSLGSKSMSLFNDDFINNKNLLYNQNYIPKEQVVLFNEKNDNFNSTKSDNQLNYISEIKNDNLNNNNENFNVDNSFVQNKNIKSTNSLLFNNNNNNKNNNEILGQITNNLVKKDNQNYQNNKEFQFYYNKQMLNQPSYNYFQYKLFDSNGEDIKKINSYNNNQEKIRLFPEEMDDSFDKNYKQNINKDNIILKNNNLKGISSNIIEVSSDLVDKIEKKNNNNSIENNFGINNKKEKSKSSSYSNDSYKPY